MTPAQREPRHWRQHKWLVAAGLTAAAWIAGSRNASVVPKDPEAPPRREAIVVPDDYAKALSSAWLQVARLSALVEQRGVVGRFGRQAESIVRRAIAGLGAGGADAESLKQVLDAPLRALFHQQLHTLLGRAVDRYDREVLARPNPLEAGWAAEREFVEGANDLVQPGSDWSYEAERQDLLDRVRRSYGTDSQIVEEQVKHGQGKQVTIEVIRKLQQQAETVRREAESRGAFPWNVKWQYMVENSPLGFRGQYSQGRSVVELLLMPHPDPRFKKNLLNRIGPLNLAVAFDMLL